MLSRKRSSEASAPLAKHPTRTDFALVSVFDASSYIEGYLSSRFDVVDVLGTGEYGVVFLASPIRTFDYDAVMSANVLVGTPYAIKVEPILPSPTPQELREKAGEILVHYAIHELQIPRLNLAVALFFTRMHSISFLYGLQISLIHKFQLTSIGQLIDLYKPTLFNITIMKYYKKGSLKKLLSSASYKRTLNASKADCVSAWVMMVTAGLHSLRQISADTVHGDLHRDNIFVEEHADYVVNVYILDDGSALLVPGTKTDNSTGKLGDFGLTTGHFITQSGQVPFQETPSPWIMPDMQKFIISFMSTVEPGFATTNAALFAIAEPYWYGFLDVAPAPDEIKRVVGAIQNYESLGPTASIQFAGQYDFELFNVLATFVKDLRSAFDALYNWTTSVVLKREIVVAQRSVDAVISVKLVNDIEFWREYVNFALTVQYPGSAVYLEQLKTNKIFDAFRCRNERTDMELAAARLGYSNPSVLQFIPTRLELLAPVEIASIKKRFML
jgi:serine/threonine protein kinase